MPYKILFCTSFLHQVQTGSAVFAQLFVQWAKEREHEINIICPETGFIPLVKHKKVYGNIPVLNEFHRSFIYYKTVKEELKKKDYDIIFFNSVVESLHTAKLVHDIPVMGMLHDENFLNDYKKTATLKRKLYRNFLQRQEQKACYFLDKILTNSMYMKNQVVNIYGVHPIKVDFSYFRSYDLDNVVDLSQNKEESLRVLFVKHDYERGGLSYLVNALRAIEDQPVSLRIIGVSSQNIPTIKKLVSGISCEIIPSRTRQEIVADYHWCSVFCVPSLSEALGLANMEAILFLKPVVAFDIPVLRELSKTDQIMDLVELRNSKHLSQAIVRAHTRDTEVNDQIQRAKKWLDERLNKEIFYKRMDRFFEG